MRLLTVALSCVVASSACRAQPHCPTEPLKIALGDRAAGAFLRGNGAEFDPVDPGIVVLEVRAAVKALGCPASLVRLPHKRILAQMEAGSIDFAVGYSDTPERLALWRFPLGPDGAVDRSMAIGQSPISWVVLRDRKVELEARWRDGRLHSQLGAVQETLAERLAAEKGFRKTPVLNLNEVPKLLVLGRFDAIAFPTMAYAEVMSQSTQPLATLEPPLGQLQYYAPASRALFERAPASVRAFWDALCDEARRRPVSPGCKR